MPTFSALVARSGSGRVKLSLSDGTTTVSAETDEFSGSGIDVLSLDTSTLEDGSVWDFDVSAKTTDTSASIDRLKVLADPVNEFSPVLALSGAGNSTNSTSFVELASGYFMAAGINVDSSGGIVALCDLDLGSASGAELRVTITSGGSSESATLSVSSSGVKEIRCPYPSVAASVASCRVEGRVTSGSGTISLRHYQVCIER
jgi:hypothetical protein